MTLVVCAMSATLLRASGAEGGPVGEPMQLVDPPAGPGAMAPNLVQSSDGVLMTWIEPLAEHEETMRVRLSRFDGTQWSAPRTVITDDPNMFANWADIPSAIETPDGTLYVHWASSSGPDPYAYDVRLATSPDGGETWTDLGPIHDDGTQTEHGFVSLVAEGDDVRAVWLDGRQMAAEPEGPMTLRSAVISGGEVGDPAILDDRVCECCNTDSARTTEGMVTVYRDRTAGEIRDIAIVRWESDRWSEPATIHEDGWLMPGCPVNGPAVAALDQSVVVAWFTGAGGEARVMAAFSPDGGASMGEPIEIDGQDPVGRVDVAYLDESTAVVCWLGRGPAESEAEVLCRTVGPRGEPGDALLVAPTGSSRTAGFPRIAAIGDAVLVAWVEPDSQTPIRAALLDPSALHGVGAATEVLSRQPSDRLSASARSLAEVVTLLQAQTLDGEPVTATQLEAVPTLINVWATWCVPCRDEIPDLAALHRAVGPEQLRIVGLSIDALPLDAIERFAEAHEIPYMIWQTSDERTLEVLGVPPLPGNFLYDRQGRLIYRAIEAIQPDHPAFADALEQALAP